MLYGVIYVAAYAISARVNVIEPLAPWTLATDRMIPFVADSIWVYISQYGLLPLLYCRMPRSRQSVARRAFAWTAAIATGVFIAFPTVCDCRIDATLALAWHEVSRSALELMYEADRPRNCLPSMHVASSAVLLAVAIETMSARARVGYSVWVFLIALSTIAIRQHYTVDVLAGGVLGLSAYALVACTSGTRPASSHSAHANRGQGRDRGHG